MRLYGSFVRRVLFPMQERIKGHSTLSRHRELEKSQWLSSKELQDLQLSRLRKFLCTIDRHVPYYTELFARHHFAPSAIKSVADISSLPLLDKALIRAHSDALTSEIAGPLTRCNTGGSSGEPLIFYLGKDRVSRDVAAKRRATRWWDVDVGDTELVIWGSPIELGSQDNIRALRDRLFATELLPAFSMSDSNLARFVQTIRKRRPKMLFGYPSSLAKIAEYASSRSQHLDGLGIRVAFVTSERLYDHQRKLIESVFGCPVANGYGGRDAGFIAHECPKGSMHITAEDIVLEVVDSEGRPVNNGETGELVVTHLGSADFPFVRYRTGDIGAISDRLCECGRSLPILEKLEGRTTDFIVAQDGTVLHGLALIYVLRDIPEVKEFRIVQESVDLVRVELCADGTLDVDVRQHIIDSFRARLGASVRVEIEELELLNREKSGKFRYVISRVVQG